MEDWHPNDTVLDAPTHDLALEKWRTYHPVTRPIRLMLTFVIALPVSWML